MTSTTAARRFAEPRMVFGLVLIVVSALLSWLLFLRLDTGETYWALARSVEPGTAVSESDFTRVQARIPQDSGFIATGGAFPAELSQLTWARSLNAGTLVRHSDLLIAGGTVAAEVPLLVKHGYFPSDIRPGDVVDIWVTPSKESGLFGDAEHVLRQVTVISVGGEGADLGLGSTIVVGLGSGPPEPSQLGIIASGDVLVIRVP